MLQNYFDYQYLNLIGIILFLTLGWLANKSDMAKDVLAFALIILLLCPVSFVVYMHFINGNWFAVVFCGLIQLGLTYCCYVFIRYMCSYHKGRKYILWE